MRGLAVFDIATRMTAFIRDLVPFAVKQRVAALFTFEFGQQSGQPDGGTPDFVMIRAGRAIAAPREGVIGVRHARGGCQSIGGAAPVSHRCRSSHLRSTSRLIM